MSDMKSDQTNVKPEEWSCQSRPRVLIVSVYIDGRGDYAYNKILLETHASLPFTITLTGMAKPMHR